MGTLASGSIDLKSLKVAGEGASKYITTIDSNNGIQIHAENNVNSNYTQIDSNGMEVFQNSISVAQFGVSTRIGVEGSNYFEINANNISAKNEFHIPLFEINSNPTEGNHLQMTIPVSEEKELFSVENFIVRLIEVKVDNQTKEEGTDFSVGPSYILFNTAVSAGSTVIIKYVSMGGFTNISLGARNVEGDIGFLSVAEGMFTTAAGNYSHAEGRGCEAIGDQSHAEGYNSLAEGLASHAEGSSGKATGNWAHVEGMTCRAAGNYSHAQNFLTNAQGEAQTVIGKKNIPDLNDTYAFIIGNGGTNTLSNAMTVDWNGNLNIADGASYQINGVSIPYITSQGTSGNWSYRKWSNGKVEVWLHETDTTLAITGAVGNMYQSSANITRTIPSAVTLTSVSYSNVDIKNANYSVWASTWNCSTTTIYFRAMSALQRTSASGYTIDAYIVGQGS